MAWNAASQVGALAVAVVLHTFYSIVIARILGSEEFGVYALVDLEQAPSSHFLLRKAII